MRGIGFRFIGAAIAAAAVMAGAGAASAAPEYASSGKLLLTGGVSNIEGAGGGGLATWATTTGYETRDGVGANLHLTYVKVSDYSLTTYGAAIGLFDRLELSYARQKFDTENVGAALGLGKGFTFDQDIVGAKLRLVGDAIYDQDSWMPQISAGVQYKKNDRGPIVRLVGADSEKGVDYYVAATKVLLSQSLVLDATLRMTRANQTGLLGFGAAGKDDYSAQFEGSAGYLVTKRLVVGAEYRSKPDNLAFAHESDWWDLFAAYAVSKNLSVTAAYVDLGDIATFRGQKGVYLSLQAGF
jgi:hypothetical protein